MPFFSDTDPLGQALLTAALCCYGAQLFCREATQRRASVAGAICGIWAFARLALAFLTSDYRFKTVAEHSADAVPDLYKFTATWGNHEGSLLLLLALAGIYGVRLAYDGEADRALKTLALRFMAGICAAFLLYVICTSNPFILLAAPPADGVGFNPLLQDVGLAAHPPVLYVGYIGLSVPFALSAAGLWRGRLDAHWAESVRRHALLAWSFLTAGIALGAWWAYRELGWGGFWFWDPVENASLMPWLASTGALHSAAITRRGERAAPWTAALFIMAFWLVVTGFFIVRSGIVTSVHAFASAPERGIFVLGMVFCVAASGVAAFAMWAKRADEANDSDPLTFGDLALGAQSLWMCVAMATILVATFYPLLEEAFTGHKISVGAPYFNGVFQCLVGPLIVGTALLSGRQGTANKNAALDVASFTFAAAACAGALCFFRPSPPLPFVALFSLAAGGVGTTTASLWRGYRRRETAPRFYRMHVAHVGAFVLLMGIFLAAFLQEEDEFVLVPGQSASVAGYSLAFERMERVRGSNYLALKGHFTAYDGMKNLGPMAAEARFYPQEGMQTAESSIIRLPGADLYLSMGEALPSGEAGVRMQYKPGIPLMWLGAALMAVAGLSGAFFSRKSRANRPLA